MPRTETSPLAELLAIGDLDQGNVVLVAESDNKLLVGLLLAVLVQDTHVSLSSVEGLGSLSEAAGETIVHESELQDTLESVKNGHLALGGIAGNLNNIGDLGGVVFYVRLYRENSSVNRVPPSKIPTPRRRKNRPAAGARAIGQQGASDIVKLTILAYFLVGRSSKISMCIKGERKKGWKNGGLSRDLEVSSFSPTVICRNLNDRVRCTLRAFLRARTTRAHRTLPPQSRLFFSAHNACFSSQPTTQRQIPRGMYD